MTRETLAQDLSEALGIEHPDLAIMAEMDPELSAEFLEMARAVKRDNVLAPKDQALIYVALYASLAQLNAPMTRAYIRAALKAGATAGEVREVLELTSVLGIHGTLPAALILTEEDGGFDEMAAHASPERTARAQAAQAAFEAKRGPMTPAWVNATYHVPGVVETYAGFSGVPWSTDHLPAKMKELVYIAIDIAPQHFHTEGTRVHMRKAASVGATPEEINSVLQMVSLIGVQTHLLALPILKEEMAALGL